MHLCTQFCQLPESSKLRAKGFFLLVFIFACSLQHGLTLQPQTGFHIAAIFIPELGLLQCDTMSRFQILLYPLLINKWASTYTHAHTVTGAELCFWVHSNCSINHWLSRPFGTDSVKKCPPISDILTHSYRLLRAQVLTVRRLVLSLYLLYIYFTSSLNPS